MKTLSNNNGYKVYEVTSRRDAILDFMKNPVNVFFALIGFYLFVYGPILLTTWILHNPMGGMVELVAGDFLRNNVSSLSGLSNSEFNAVMGDMILDFVLLPIKLPSYLLDNDFVTGIFTAVIGGLLVIIVFLSPAILCLSFYRFLFKR